MKLVDIANKAAAPIKGLRRMRYIRIRINETIVFDVDRKLQKAFPTTVFDDDQIDLLVNYPRE